MDRLTEEELSEKKLYDKVYSFLSSYPEEVTKAGKSVTRKHAKKDTIFLRGVPDSLGYFYSGDAKFPGVPDSL